MVACPHCGLETTLYVPQTPLPKPPEPKKPSPPLPEPTKPDATRRSPRERLVRFCIRFLQRAKDLLGKTSPSEQLTGLYYYKIKDATKGPYTVEQLRGLWMNGQITADALYRSEDSSQWLPLRESPVLSTGKSGGQIVPIEIKRRVSQLGIAALALGIISGLFCLIPVPGALTISFAVSGLLLAFGGLIMAIVNRRTGFLLPLSGAFVCVLSILITNYVPGGQSFRRVEGKLRTVKQISGECTHVARNGVVVQQFVIEVERVYGPRKSSSWERKGLVTGNFPSPRTVLSSKETTVPTQRIFLRNYKNMQAVAIGTKISAQAMLVGTIDVKGERLECWDCVR